MSSFFTVPASQRKRKRQDDSTVSLSKRRNTKPTGATGKSQATNRSKAKATPVADEDDESISGSESEDEGRQRKSGRERQEDESSSEDDSKETAAERRLKLAERYLENIRTEIGEGQEVGFDAADVDRELIASRLKEDVAEDKGHLYRHIAGELDYERANQTFFRADTLATTGVAVCPPYAYTVSKDMTIIKWELAPPPSSSSSSPLTNGNASKKPKPIRRKPKQVLYTRGNKHKSEDPTYQHHTGAILCIAVSATGKFLATGGADRKLIIWDPETLTPLKVFTQHRDSVMGVAFRGKTHQLFSASKDRTIKIWSLDELAYIETLFGHQDEVVAVAAVGGKEERCVSVGARDRTARLWKVVEESQLVFRGGGGGIGSNSNRKSKDYNNKNAASTTAIPDGPLPPPTFNEGSLDAITQPSTTLFLTGSDSGSLSLFTLHKKKPLHVLPLAHGFDPAIPAHESSVELDFEAAGTKAGPTARWITALACVPYSDLVISGSWDGVVRCWRIGGGTEGSEGRKIEPVGVLGATSTGEIEVDNKIGTVKGVINSLAVFHRTAGGGSASARATGVCIVVGVGTETRLGRWIQKKEAKNGAIVFEVPMKKLAVNGVASDGDAVIGAAESR